jgi:hypothetical protein
MHATRGDWWINGASLRWVLGLVTLNCRSQGTLMRGAAYKGILVHLFEHHHSFWCMFCGVY